MLRGLVLSQWPLFAFFATATWETRGLAISKIYGGVCLGWGEVGRAYGVGVGCEGEELVDGDAVEGVVRRHVDGIGGVLMVVFELQAANVQVVAACLYTLCM